MHQSPGGEVKGYHDHPADNGYPPRGDAVADLPQASTGRSDPSAQYRPARPAEAEQRPHVHSITEVIE